MSDRVYMPHAGHLVTGSSCQFRLNTCVTGKDGKRYIVSTVGEYCPSFSREHLDEIVRSGVREPLRARTDAEGFEEIGLNRLYETMVFPAVASGDLCCPWRMESGENIDFAGYNERADAATGHETMCLKWERQ